MNWHLCAPRQLALWHADLSHKKTVSYFQPAQEPQSQIQVEPDRRSIDEVQVGLAGRNGGSSSAELDQSLPYSKCLAVHRTNPALRHCCGQAGYNDLLTSYGLAGGISSHSSSR